MTGRIPTSVYHERKHWCMRLTCSIEGSDVLQLYAAGIVGGKVFWKSRKNVFWTRVTKSIVTVSVEDSVNIYFGSRIRESVILNKVSGAGRPTDYPVQIRQDLDPTWTFLWPLKKFCCQKGITIKYNIKYQTFYLKFVRNRIFDK